MSRWGSFNFREIADSLKRVSVFYDELVESKPYWNPIYPKSNDWTFRNSCEEKCHPKNVNYCLLTERFPDQNVFEDRQFEA